MAVTWDPYSKHTDITLSGGNLVATRDAVAGWACVLSTDKCTGKVYWELKMSSYTPSSNVLFLGITSGSDAAAASYDCDSYQTWHYMYEGYKDADQGRYSNDEDIGDLAASSCVAEDDIVMFAFDVDAGKLWFGLNGTWLEKDAGGPYSPDPATATDPIFTGIDTGTNWYPNFWTYDNGSQGHQATGQFASGDWTYSAPSGFTAIVDSTESFGDDIGFSEEVIVQDLAGVITETIGFEEVTAQTYLKADDTSHDVLISVVTLTTTFVPFTGEGDVELPSLTMTASRGAVFDEEFPALEVSGTISPFMVTSAEVTLPFLEVEAVGGAFAKVTLPELTAVCDTSYELDLSIEGAVTLPSLVVDAATAPSASVEFPSLVVEATTGTTAIVTLPILTISADVTVPRSLDGDVTIPALTIDAGVTVGRLANGEVTIPTLTADSRLGEVASSEISLPALEATGTTKWIYGEVELPSLRALSISGSKKLRGDIELPSISVEASSGNNGAVSLPSITAQGVIHVGVSATVTLPSLEVQGMIASNARADVTIPALVVSSDVTVPKVFSGLITLPKLTISAQSASEVLATFDDSLPSLALDGSCLRSPLGEASIPLPPLSIVSTAVTGTKYTGTVTLPAITIAITAGVYMDSVDGDITLSPLEVEGDVEPFGLDDYTLEYSRSRGRCA